MVFVDYCENEETLKYQLVVKKGTIFKGGIRLEKMREKPKSWVCIIHETELVAAFLKIKKYKNLKCIAFEFGDPAQIQSFSEELPDVKFVLIRNIDDSFFCKTMRNIPDGWEDFFIKQSKLYGPLEKIGEFLDRERHLHKIYPSEENIYKMFHLIQPKKIKVVIIGQDPYHGEGQANGIAFSVDKNIHPPPSLKNIFKELRDTGFGVTNSNNGDLTPWCKQGVFLINTALTVREKEPGSHSDIWTKDFTPNLMSWINENCNQLVIILWGNHAKRYGAYFGEKHFKIESAHPSPLSANNGFYGSDPFNKANKILQNLNKQIIDWSL